MGEDNYRTARLN